MADKSPELSAVVKYQCFRLDHRDFKVAQAITFAKGIIKDMGLVSTDPFVLDGTCTVEVDGVETAGVPIFYHCRNDITQEDMRTLEGPGDLQVPKFGTWAFIVSDEVKVMLRDGKPAAVIDIWGDKQKLRRCAYYIFVYTYPWWIIDGLGNYVSTVSYGSWNLYNLLNQSVYSAQVIDYEGVPDTTSPKDPWGNLLFPPWASPLPDNYWIGGHSANFYVSVIGLAQWRMDEYVIVGPCIVLVSFYYYMGYYGEDDPGRQGRRVEIYMALFNQDLWATIQAITGGVVGAFPPFPGGLIYQSSLTTLINTPFQIDCAVYLEEYSEIVSVGYETDYGVAMNVPQNETISWE